MSRLSACRKRENGCFFNLGTLSSSAHLALRPVQRRLLLAMLTCSAEAVYLENILMTSVPHHSRAAGKSNYTLRALIFDTFTLMTDFSVWPLQVASIVGFGFTIFGILVFAYVVICFFVEGRSVPGFPFLASIIAIFSGAQMFALGIMGEYLARMHFRMMERPAYVVWKNTGDQSNQKTNPRVSPLRSRSVSLHLAKE
jgi:hypothetical protein